MNDLSRQKSDTPGKKGAVIMNCNPFTNGHRYLIENASSKVDFLYIFVLEENKSFFEFDDRIDLVKKGTADLNNVKVFPSGRFIISSLTFPGYFTKETDKEATIDASTDLRLFAEAIAPTLGISVRFAGTEPFCKITKQYNESMKNLLPMHGIEFVEIERFAPEGEAISASRVRELMKLKEFDRIKQLVPETTYKYIIDNIDKFNLE